MENSNDQNDLSENQVNDKNFQIAHKEPLAQESKNIEATLNKNCEIEENGLSHNETAKVADDTVDENAKLEEKTEKNEEKLEADASTSNLSKHSIEPSESSAEITEKPPEASKSPVGTVENTSEVSEKPIEESENPLETSENPLEASENPIEVPENPLEASENPIEVSENPIETLEVQENPLDILEGPIEPPKNPLEIPDSPTPRIEDEEMPQADDSLKEKEDEEEEEEVTEKPIDESIQNEEKEKDDDDSIEIIASTSSDVFKETQKVDEETDSQDNSNSNENEKSTDSNDASEVNFTDNTVFVQVNPDNEKDADKNINNEQGNEEPQEDPIASDCFTPTEEEDSKDAEQGADEELCIIPDTERIISQEEREAASSMIPLRSLPENDADSEEIFNSNHELEDHQKGKYVISKYTDETTQECVQCLVARKSNYVAILDKKSVYICDDNCLNSFKEENPGKFISNVASDIRVKNMANDSSFLSKIDFTRNCAECKAIIESNNDAMLSWETMDFCGEMCLGKYQKSIGGCCCTCKTEVRLNFLGKYCVRFGNEIRQFCSSTCLDEYKKNLKICSLCQKNITQDGGGFLAPVGDKGQFKDFCSESCMDKYNEMATSKVPEAKEGVTCSVCLHENPITIEYEHDNKNHLICSVPCLIAFKFVNKITPGKCDKCLKYFDIKVLEKNCMYFEDSQRTFCSKTCQSLFLNSNRRIVPCSWCKVKKYNFDMIRRTNNAGQILMMCSLNCLSLYHVSVNAVNSKKICCDQCLRNLKPLYHLTMSDATLRNFCSYECVMSFQNQFSKTPITLGEQSDNPVPTGQPKRAKRSTISEPEPTPSSTASFPSLPVISNVQSLASTTNGTVTTRSNKTKTTNATNGNSVPVPTKTQIKQQLIVKPAPLPQQRNVATMCSVAQESKGTNIKPTTESVETQTDEQKDKTVIIPIPVPIFVPTPVHMFSMPFPMPFPFALPVPVPIFIPTTRNSANGIMKEIKKIQVKIPTDPFEAELLMMAEMVADDKKEENTDSETEEEETGPADEGGGTFSPEPVDASNTFGDDMLQMALKMATELDEPAVDLEGALTASTITASQSGETSGNDEAVDDPQPMNQIIERQGVRGRKRGMKQTKQNTGSKRGRRSTSHTDVSVMAPPQPPAPPEPIEKPDANMCLKYTFGVNAWKQWVTTKNAELEKTSRRVKLFKPEILQLTADELNYSLCLFVKEVRKPNGSEYAPDTIYYLCLGIQQYLFENGRIDNIFCDAYYEKFTDCLDEVARKFSVLYNDSHYIVTRVEEEHLWESKQLGAHSPHVLLSTLMFFNTKHFNLTTVDEHMQLSFSHIMKHWKRNPNQPGTAKVPGSRNVLLRFYPPQSALDGNARKKKVYEQQENEENPLRCPVKLYEFYLSKCPESVKTRNDVFYLQPERSCVPDSPVWYSTMPLGREALEKMLHRVKMVKEINVALLTS